MSTTPRPVTREIGYTRIGQSGNLWWPFFQDDEETPELRWPESVKVYGRMSKDSQVLSVSSAVSRSRLPRAAAAATIPPPTMRWS